MATSIFSPKMFQLILSRVQRDMSIEHVAKLCHDANCLYSETLGEELAEWEKVKDSAIDGVKAHLTSELTPEQSHERWLAFKLADGWRYGPTKDFEAKTHPCFMPYCELPKAQRDKDLLFGSVVKMCKPLMATSLFDGTPDSRQSDSTMLSKAEQLFRPKYRKLESEEVELHNAIKEKALELAQLMLKVKETPHTQLAIQHLEDAVYRIVKGLTA